MTDSRQWKIKKLELSGSLCVLSGEKAGEDPGGGFIGIVEGLYSSIPITKSTGVSVPLSELGPLFPPPQASVAPPLDLRGGEQHSLAGEGVGGPKSGDWIVD